MNIVIKPFSTPLGNYIYDRETNSILSVQDEEYAVLKRVSKRQATDNDLKILEAFQSRGFCKESALKEIEHPQDKFLDFHLENKIEKITLQVTQSCNLRCSYCPYSGGYDQRTHNDKMMPYETMLESVDFIMKRSINQEKIDIGFYGGEPLLAFQNIKKIVAYVRETYPYKNVSFSVTTNGTLLTKRNAKFLQDNDFSITVSLDGPKELHDQNRVFTNGEGSFDTMMDNLKSIRSEYPELFKKIAFNTVIAPGNDYKCVSDFFDASDIIEDNSLFAVPLNDFNSKDEIQYDERYFITYKIQKVKMLLAELGHISRDQVSNILSQDMANLIHFYNELGKANISPTAHPGGPCIPGAKRPMIDIHGHIYPCERVSEASDAMRIGNIVSGFDMKKTRDVLNIGEITKKECLKCWNFIHCSLCAAAADDTRAFSRKEKLGRCASAKYSTLATLETICLLKENNFNFEKEHYYG